MDRKVKKQQSRVNETMIPPWSDLPEELIERIGNCLNTEIDFLRFRAVCNLWHNSLINPPFKNTPQLPIILPFPINQNVGLRPRFGRRPKFYLIESTVYLFQPSVDDNLKDNGSASATYRGWLIKVTKTHDRKLRLFDPLTEEALPPAEMPKVLNLLNFRVSQVCKSYHVQYFAPSKRPYRDSDVQFVKKILFSTNHFSLMAIDFSKGEQLFCLKLGEDKWTKLKDATFNIVDITVYKGNFYAVDRYGKTIEFDSEFNETTIVSSILNDVGRRKRLVESQGQLFLVDIVLDFDKPKVEIKTYQLDEEQHEWIQVHTLGDRIFFAGDDCCFSVSSQDFGECCRGNCIYFANRLILKDILGGERYKPDNYEHDPIKKRVHKYFSKVLQLDRCDTGVYTIEDCKLGSPLSFITYGDIPWPPPSWLKS